MHLFADVALNGTPAFHMARTLSARSIAAASKRRKARFEVAASGGWKSCALLGGGRRADPLDRPPWVQAKPLTVQLALGVGCSANSKSAGAEHHHDGGWTLRLTVSFELVARVHLRRILRLCLSPIEGGAAGGGRAWPQRPHGDRHLATARLRPAYVPVPKPPPPYVPVPKQPQWPAHRAHDARIPNGHARRKKRPCCSRSSAPRLQIGTGTR